MQLKKIPCRTMSLFVSSLNSGSNGNCYYVGNQHEAVLIDGGISCRETEKRLKRLGLSMQNVKAIFISHEHGDHIHGVPALSKKFHLPVYITPQTLRSTNIPIAEHLIFSFQPHQEIQIGKLKVRAFPKFHDATDPHSFVVSSETVNVGVFTDIGDPCRNLIEHFRQCHAAFLEANYDDEMLENGSYPYRLKNRIRGGYGHLSNRKALKIFRQHKPAFMSHLFLSHLSADNNNPELVKTMFSAVAGRTEIIVASRKQETRLYHIRNSGKHQSTFSSRLIPEFQQRVQLSLF